MAGNDDAKAQAVKAMEAFFAKRRAKQEKKAQKPKVGALFKKAKKQAQAKQACFTKKAEQRPEDKENRQAVPKAPARVADGKVTKAPKTSRSDITRPLRLVIRLSKEDADQWKKERNEMVQP